MFRKISISPIFEACSEEEKKKEKRRQKGNRAVSKREMSVSRGATRLFGEEAG